MEETIRPVRNDAALAATILFLGLLLAALGQLLITRWQSTAAKQALAFEDLLGFAATTTGVATVAWWLTTFLLAIVAALLRKVGRSHSANTTDKLSPAFMRRLAFAILGLNLLGIPLANAAPVPVEPAWSPTDGPIASISISARWAPDATPAEQQFTMPSGESGASEIEPRWQPGVPVTEPGLLGSRPQRVVEQSDAPSQSAVVVARGDSLWSIAARQLGPMSSEVDIALHWPKWYATNRNVIGDDPGLLAPGQILQPPPRS